MLKGLDGLAVVRDLGTYPFVRVLSRQPGARIVLLLVAASVNVAVSIALRGIQKHGAMIATTNRASGGLRVEVRLPKEHDAGQSTHSSSLHLQHIRNEAETP